MKVGVFILSYIRPNTTAAVVDSILHQSVKPEVIYVFNNNPKVTVNYNQCININSQENFGCIIRHYIALVKNEIDYWLFIDDDVKVKPKSIESFLTFANKYPEAILGYYGRNVVMPGLYSLDSKNLFTNQEKDVDIILGMVHFCHRNKLFNSFILRKDIPDLPITEDDIILSLANKYIDKQKNYVIPYDIESGPIPLDSGILGLSAQGGHRVRRVDAVRQILIWTGQTFKPDPEPKFKKFEKI
jgi:hypothetical protein